mmetsp:Transcript_91176/g.279111  ORF Transcript_91176/g.279111 Transcript_91176/m.279111 type:complete len:263 (-) Transcript_91176:413-1201(-)
MLRLHDRRHEVPPAGRGKRGEQERDDKTREVDAWLPDNEIVGCEHDGHQYDVHGTHVEPRQEKCGHADAARTLAPEYVLVISEDLQAEDGEQQRQASVQIEKRRRAPARDDHDPAVQDRQDDAAEPQGGQEEGALRVDAVPLDGAPAEEHRVLAAEARRVAPQALQRKRRCRRQPRGVDLQALPGARRTFLLGNGEAAERAEVVQELGPCHDAGPWASHLLHQLLDDVVRGLLSGTIFEHAAQLLGVHVAAAVADQLIPTLL